MTQYVRKIQTQIKRTQIERDKVGKKNAQDID